MKASELVKQLQTLIDQHGDLEVAEIEASIPGASCGGLRAVTEVELHIDPWPPTTKVFLLGF